MIIVIGLLVIVTIALEVFLFKQRSAQKENIERVKRLNTELEILKALSYIPISKRKELIEDLHDLSASFFLQDKFTAFSLISSKGSSDQVDVWRYEKKQLENQNNSSKPDFKLNSLEEFLLKEAKQQTSSPIIVYDLAQKITGDTNITKYKSAAIIPLADNDLEFGYLILLNQENAKLSDDETNFASAVGKICTMTMMKWYISSRIPLDEQFKAVNTAW